MGTHATTKVKDGEATLVNLYRHYDGYLDGHGRELAVFLNEQGSVATQDLAAAIVAHFQQQPGDVYPVDRAEEYDYVIRRRGEGIRVTVLHYGLEIFDGTVAELLERSRRRG